MKKAVSILMLITFTIGVVSSCKSSKSAVDKRTHKKRNKKGSLDCPMKDC